MAGNKLKVLHGVYVYLQVVRGGTILLLWIKKLAARVHFVNAEKQYF